LTHALVITSFTFILCGNSTEAMANLKEATVLADETGAVFWKAIGMASQGCAFALTGQIPSAVTMISSGLDAFRSTGSTLYTPWYLTSLAAAYAELGQFDDASHCIGEAVLTVQTTKERWCEAEIHRIAGEIALRTAKPDVAKARTAFARALTIARSQRAKSWELRAATSLARVMRDNGERDNGRELLEPVYGSFTDRLVTRDLREANALLDELR